MSSHCRVSTALALVLLFVAGCEREHREYSSPPETRSDRPRLTSFQPGVPSMEAAGTGAQHYERNAFHINQGGLLFRQFNCNGCHGAGGGAIGPALMDDQWRYGGRIDQVHASIMDGRPNGMPAWREKLTDTQAWQLAAYVRALSGNVSKAAAPSRRDGMTATPPLTQLPDQPPSGTDPSAQQPPPP